jgi:hypothetical protein
MLGNRFRTLATSEVDLADLERNHLEQMPDAVPGGRMTTRIARKELKEMLRGERFRWVDAVVFVLLAEKGARGHWEEQAGEPALGGRLLRFPDPTSSGGRRR